MSKQTQDAASNVALNGVHVDGEKIAWDKAFTRLSDEGMRAVREAREQAGAVA